MSKVISSDKYRITVLTDRLIRLEYSEEGSFEDRISRMAVKRDLGDVKAVVSHEGDALVVETDQLVLRYDEKEFTSLGLSITLKNFETCWHYSAEYPNSGQNLRGTARTLDEADGAISLGSGIFGREGYAVISDGDSPVFDDSLEEFVLRKAGNIDIFFFGYGRDYYGGLKDYFRLCGKTPLIPRYALGNWWSRFFKYSEESYTEVVDKFEAEQIPLSVAVIDMDWHITDVDPKYGTGWTGYTWNKELFPDYKRFLSMLHTRGLKTTLNLHPADGIRAFEEAYERCAKRMGIDPESEQAIEFDLANKDIRDTYFEEIIQPYEKDGVDFWWIDWQQGLGRKPSDVDPLFLLNHYHYRDQEKRNKRPMIFSRYAGPGSHRYPIGFSGDTVSTWRSLDFQPYFTSASSNIGYGWWSHDIGGHMMGDKDNERLIRWIQYGVFSPVMRLHSSCSPFFNKEPWVIDEPYRSVMKHFMRLRHRLVPYLYTENYRAYSQDKPLIRPMYYDNAECEDAYRVPNEYGFGENLIVGAITGKADERLRLSSVNMLIPEGRYVDILTGRVYKGGRTRKLYRDITQIPVLMKAGTILPLAPDSGKNGTDNPEKLTLLVAAGDDGSYTLYEDDGNTMDYTDGRFAETAFECDYHEKEGTLTVTIKPATGDLSLIPSVRDYEITVLGAGEPKTVTAFGVKADTGAVVTVDNVLLRGNDHIKEVFDILERAYIEINIKDMVYNAVSARNREDFLNWLAAADISESLKDVIREVFED